MLLVGLWYGRQKPNINAFMEKPLQEINIIHERGGEICHTNLLLVLYICFSFVETHFIVFSAIICNGKENNEIKFLVHLHSLICDLPGKAIATLHKLFNGKFGCMVTCSLV